MTSCRRRRCCLSTSIQLGPPLCTEPTDSIPHVKPNTTPFYVRLWTAGCSWFFIQWPKTASVAYLQFTNPLFALPRQCVGHACVDRSFQTCRLGAYIDLISGEITDSSSWLIRFTKSKEFFISWGISILLPATLEVQCVAYYKTCQLFAIDIIVLKDRISCL